MLRPALQRDRDMAEKTVNPAARQIAAAAFAAAMTVSAVGRQPHAQSAPSPAAVAAVLSTDEFAHAVATLSPFSQKAGS